MYSLNVWMLVITALVMVQRSLSSPVVVEDLHLDIPAIEKRQAGYAAIHSSSGSDYYEPMEAPSKPGLGISVGAVGDKIDDTVGTVSKTLGHVLGARHVRFSGRGFMNPLSAVSSVTQSGGGASGGRSNSPLSAMSGMGGFL